MKRLSFLVLLPMGLVLFAQDPASKLIAQIEDSKARADQKQTEAEVPALVKVLQDTKADRNARTSAALALGRIGGEKVVEPLRSVLDDKHIGWAAITALGSVGPTAKLAVPDLAKIAG